MSPPLFFWPGPPVPNLPAGAKSLPSPAGSFRKNALTRPPSR